MNNTVAKKPYNRCVDCEHLGKICDGPNFVAMTPERLMEWCRLRKEYLGLSNARLAELAGMPKGTVDRLLAGGHADYKFATIQPMLKTLVGGTWGQYPCPDPDNLPPDNETLLKLLEQKEVEIEQLYADMRALSEENKRNVAHAEADGDRRVAYLKDQVQEQKGQIREMQGRIDKTSARITWLVILALALAGTIIVALFVDRTSPDLGFIWRTGFTPF